MKNTLSIILLLFSFGIFNSLLAQEDIKNSEDHPLLTRYPGTHIASYEKIKFREYNLAHGPITSYKKIKDTKKVSGQLYRITYIIDESVEKLSIGEVYLDYKQALKKAGITLLGDGLFSGRNNKKEIGGGSWIGVALKDNGFPQGSKATYLFAGTSSSGGTFSIIGKVNQKEGTTYVAIYGERHSKSKIVCHVDIIEEKSAETGKVFADANYIKNEIEEMGMVTIYGINFDFDSAKIKADSKPTLDEIAKFLTDNPSIKIYVVGHTDMKGSLSYNLTLSKNRAKAIVDALVKTYKIDTSRLEEGGVGPLSPKSTNQSEDGRYLNRRVELVKKIGS
ncbi:MAG: OmpA family protein [Saprospiraceae bacterium]